MTPSPSWSKFIKHCKALASPDALQLIKRAKNPAVAALELVEPVIVTERLQHFDAHPFQSMIARGGRP